MLRNVSALLLVIALGVAGCKDKPKDEAPAKDESGDTAGEKPADSAKPAAAKPAEPAAPADDAKDEDEPAAAPDEDEADEGGDDEAADDSGDDDEGAE